MKKVKLVTRENKTLEVVVTENGSVNEKQTDLFNEDNFEKINDGHEGMEGFPFEDFNCGNKLIFRKYKRTWLKGGYVQISNTNYHSL